MEKVIQIILNDCLKKYGVDLRQDQKAMKRISEAAAQAEQVLSQKARHEISLPFLGVFENDGETSPFHYIREISQSEIH